MQEEEEEEEEEEEGNLNIILSLNRHLECYYIDGLRK